MHICNVHIIAQFVGAGGQEDWHVKTALSYTVGYQYSFLRNVSSDTKKGKLMSKTRIRQCSSDIGIGMQLKCMIVALKVKRI
jgi:hypothetical protein